MEERAQSVHQLELASQTAIQQYQLQATELDKQDSEQQELQLQRKLQPWRQRKQTTKCSKLVRTTTKPQASSLRCI